MREIFSKHKQSVSEIRRLALLCHGLDLSSTVLNDGSSQYEVGDGAKEVLHEQIPCNLLALAIALRVNFYQKQYLEVARFDVRDYAGMYWEDEMTIVKTTVKDVCDKIVHADIFEKSVLQNTVANGSYSTIKMRGQQRKEKWTLDLCVAVSCEKVPFFLDQAERNA